MTNPGAASVSETVQVNADPAAVYALLTDLASFAELAEETQSMEWQKGSAATVGAVFTGHNRNGS